MVEVVGRARRDLGMGDGSVSADDQAEAELRAVLRAAWCRSAAAAGRESGWVPRDDRDAILYTAALALEMLIPVVAPLHVAANFKDHADFARLIGSGFRAGGPRWFQGPSDMTLIAATDAGPPFEAVALCTPRSRLWGSGADPFDRMKKNTSAWDLARLLTYQSRRHVWAARLGLFPEFRVAVDSVVEKWGAASDETLVVFLPEGQAGGERSAAARMWRRGRPLCPWVISDLCPVDSPRVTP